MVCVREREREREIDRHTFNCRTDNKGLYCIVFFFLVICPTAHKLSVHLDPRVKSFSWKNTYRNYIFFKCSPKVFEPRSIHVSVIH